MAGFADAYGINLPAIDQAAYQTNAFKREQAQQDALQRFGAEAFAPDATDATRSKAISDLAAVDPATAVKFQDVFTKMSDAQRQHAKDLNNIIGATAYSLKQLPPEQRAARLQSQIPNLVASGIPIEKIQSVDLSDAGLDSLVNQARTLDQLIEQHNADQKRTDERSDHADLVRHQQVMERQGAAQLAETRAQHAYERNKPIAVAPGATLYDPTTGQPAFQAAPSPKDQMKAQQAADAKASKARQTLEKADNVIGKIDEAIGKSNGMTTGIAGAALRGLPGTGAFSLDRTIDTIKANVGFDALQALRDASPTGGALGQVSEMENRLLQSTIASLDTRLPKEELLKNLADVKRHYENVRMLINGQRPPDSQLGDGTQPGHIRGQPQQGGGVIDFNSLPPG